MQGFTIEYAADYPKTVAACAAWAYGRWGVQKETASLDNALKIFRQGAQKDAIPLTIVAINKNTGLPVAMGSLWESDGERWTDCTPWIAAVFTLYRYRNLGIARAVIARLEKEAKTMGYRHVYLKSGSAAKFYVTLGYQLIETVETDETAAGTETLFQKALI